MISSSGLNNYVSIMQNFTFALNYYLNTVVNSLYCFNNSYDIVCLNKTITVNLSNYTKFLNYFVVYR